MTYDEKKIKFLSKTAREAFNKKTDKDELPFLFGYCSSSHNPEQNVQVETSDIVLWVKFLDKWFKPYGRFDHGQIDAMIDICINDNQVISLMELLSAEKENN